MGKIILEFDSFEESAEARNALDGSKWKIAMWDLDQKLRGVTKYGASMFGNQEASEEESKICDHLRDEIRVILSQSNLDLED